MLFWWVRYVLNSSGSAAWEVFSFSLVLLRSSFPDLFKQSLSKLDTIYYMINSLVDGTPSVDPVSLGRLLNELGNYSYHSGLPCRD